MSGLDFLLLGLLAAGVFLALRSIRRAQKRGCSGCCRTCGRCRPEK